MRLYQTADTLQLTGLTKNQLREWCSVRNLIPADILPNGPGRHALFSWQTALALRLLKSIHDDWAGEVASWAEPIRTFRGAIEHTAFPSLWGTVVRFDKDRPSYYLQADVRSCRRAVANPSTRPALALCWRRASPSGHLINFICFLLW